MNNYSNRTLSSWSSGGFIQKFQLFYVPTLVFFGITGNIICAVVFSTKTLRRLRSSSYLLTLAISDIFFLLDLLPGWIYVAFVRRLYNFHMLCKIQTYISFVVPFVHIWIVLAFTAERFFAVTSPLKHMSRCTASTSHKVITIILIPAFLFYIYPAFFASEVDDRGQCREKREHVHHLNNINIVDTFMTMFLPFILVSILNILIIRKLFCSETFRMYVFENGSRYHTRRTSNWTTNTSIKIDQASITHSSVPSSPQRSPNTFRKVHTIPPIKCNIQQHTANYRAFTNRSSSHSSLNSMAEKQLSHRVSHPQPSHKTFQALKSTSGKKRTDTVRNVLTEVRLTKMLLAISFTCLSLNFPSYYLRLMFFYEHTKDNDNNNNETTITIMDENKIKMITYRDMMLLYLSYLSYSINILIYLFFGANFRRALKRLCCTVVTQKRTNERENTVLLFSTAVRTVKSYSTSDTSPRVSLLKT
ncbi:unnamed protein product [Didymodactylos carnosus]|uniref:G-protein coupled receptors family 1 profile domain-containing protein n=1 Tax=Didymodactylos carnosus TaxID=1234261 RepID=A0A813NUG6_9BILA|nr:unnamed protein product [Didymodactylos carnosus]CAF0816332.1 unnamed protein product [Didymodactylos carnosus]CAF3519035.1 unnamed protein product [Didymodactylos carnosus]CAF3600414.1 unnamed protein product [Didymodactylos carnosus]